MGWPKTRGEPGAVVRVLAPDDAKVALLQGAGQRADAAVADRDAVDREDRHDLLTRAAPEQLVGGVELGAVDRALDHRAADRRRRDLEHRVAGDALEDVARQIRRVQAPVPGDEQAGARALRHLAGGGQHDHAVIPVLAGLDLGRAVVDVVAGAFDAGRQRVVGEPRPAADPHVDAFGDAFGRAAGQGARDQPDRPGLRQLVVAAEIGDQADVDVLAQLVGAQHAQHAVLEVARGVDLGVAHQLHAEAQPFQMLRQAKDEQLALGRAPIGPDALEHAAAVLDHARKGMDAGVLIGHDRTIQAHELGGRHRYGSGFVVYLWP